MNWEQINIQVNEEVRYMNYYLFPIHCELRTSNDYHDTTKLERYTTILRQGYPLLIKIFNRIHDSTNKNKSCA